LRSLKRATGIPLVLHGGSGIRKRSILSGIANGISKINIATDLRQPYEQCRRTGKSTGETWQVVYDRTRHILANVLEVENSRDIINPS
jgi:fructose/tagatose bisphosphate aldolase